MKKHTILFLAIAVFAGAILCTSCSPRKKSVAELRAEKHIKDSLDLIAQQRSLVYYDSLLQALLPTIDPMLKRFYYEKNEQYEDKGHYVHKLLKTTSNTTRNFLQVYIADDGETSVKCYYYGSFPLKTHTLILTADSLSNSFTGNVHTFEAEGYHETMTISGDEALQLLQFIDINQANRIMIAMQGAKSTYKYVLSANDKTALMETYQLGVIMRDINQLERQIKQTSLQISKYQKRLEKQAASQG